MKKKFKFVTLKKRNLFKTRKWFNKTFIFIIFKSFEFIFTDRSINYKANLNIWPLFSNLFLGIIYFYDFY